MSTQTKASRRGSVHSRSRRGDRFLVQHHPDLAAQKIEQDGDALVVRHAFEQAEAGIERATDDLNPVAAMEARASIETDEPAFVLAAAQILDDGVRHDRRIFAMTDQMADADGRLDRPPALHLPVD